MLYNLEFIKIGPEFELAGVGFAGNIFITLNAILHLGNDDTLRVDMTKEECACTEKTKLFNTDNCWEYYFNQANLPINQPYNTLNSLLSAKIQYGDSFTNPKIYSDLKHRFFSNFSLKDNVKQSVDSFYNQNIKGKHTLGVQVRLTDMKYYHKVSDVDVYLRRVDSLLEEDSSIEQIFLATDDSRVIAIFQEHFSVPIVYYTDMFRADDINPHNEPYDRFKSYPNNHRYNMGLECLQEILTLAKCDCMLRAHISSISILACIFSDNLKNIYTL